MMSAIVERGMRLRNAFNKETFVFSGPVDDPAIARFEVVLEEGGTGGGNALVHIHPCAEEHFGVRSGQIKFVVDGEEHLLGPGERIVVPRGTPHFFANGGNSGAEMTVEFIPAQQHLRFYSNFASTAANRTQWFSKNGDPHFLLIALILNTYRDHLYLAGPPVFLQKLIFALLAPLSRVRGYRIEIEPAG
jgi:mannose-6-phosphate isomerase-like protein (cupin superfamily)